MLATLKQNNIRICSSCKLPIHADKFTRGQTYYLTPTKDLASIKNNEPVTVACMTCLADFLEANKKMFLCQSDFKNRTILVFRESFFERIAKFFHFKRKAKDGLEKGTAPTKE